MVVYLRSARDSGDLERRERLPMPGLAPVVLPAAELEDDDLGRAVLADDLGLDLGSADERRADLHAVAAADEEHVTEGDAVADVAGELLHTEPIALRHSILLSARLDHRVHG